MRQPQSNPWLLGRGLKQLELLFRSIVYPPAEPILIADDDRNYRDASCGAGKLFGLPRSRIIGRKIDDFAEPGFKPQLEQIWGDFLRRGEQRGTFRLLDAGGSVREVEFVAKGNALPGRHVLALRDKTSPGKLTPPPGAAGTTGDPAWVQDYAVYMLDPEGRVAAWYPGAERIYGYNAKEIASQPGSCLYPADDTPGIQLQEELKRAVAQGHLATEDWHMKKDGSRFWANVLTVTLRSESGELQGFARVVRDFS